MRKRIDSANTILILRMFNTYAYITSHQVSVTIGISINNARKYLKLLHELKLIYIIEYNRSKAGPPLPLYSLGTKQDAPYLTRIPPVTHTKRYKERMKKICLSTLWWT